MSNEISVAPVSIMVEGKTRAERQVSVVHHATPQAINACIAMKGKVGNAIREAGARSAIVDIAQHCASGSYRSLGEYLAIRLGEPIVISNRASFESLPDIFQARIMKAKLAKNEGMRLDKKTGLMVAGSKLALEMELKNICVELVAHARQVNEERKAKAAALAA